MANINLPLAAAVALVPVILSFVWYNPALFGKPWMEAAGLTDESRKKMNMPLVMGLFYFFSFLLAISLHFTVIHQFGFTALLVPEKDHPLSPETVALAKSLYEPLGSSFRTLRHGAIHGTITGIFFVLPILAINALFEMRGWKYILIQFGFWTICCALMGALICQFA